ncbi:MAG: hypothetical protein K0U98_20955 [Deltaproteobacteria bacterium]|nr:hypothetical protein [Deltaproteobacteria bacterium]
MEYPGNPSLSDDIKSRIISTFEQTLESARKGKRQEAQLGCDFILKLDAEFEPARKLAELLRTMDATASEAEEPSVDHLGEMKALLENRRFEDLLEYASANESAIAGDAELGGLLSEARSRLEAEPYVSGFLESAREAVRAGEIQKVAGLLAKAKALDPQHPGIAPLEQLASTQSDPSATVRIPLDFSLDLEKPADDFELADSNPEASIPPVEQAAAASSVSASLPSLDDDPLAAFAVQAEPPAPAPAFEAATPTNPPSLEEASPPKEAAVVAGPDESASFEEDPFAALEADLGGEVLGADADDDPFAAFSLGSPGGLDDELTAEPSGPAAPALEEDVFGAFAGDPGAGEAESAGAEIPDSGDERINELLADGQKAFQQGDHQGAIDAWSRIFLIDVDNEEASQRIEKARRLKAESERQVEEVYHDGLTAWEQGDAAKAREAFERVLELQPSHVAASELLEQISTAEAEGVPLPPVDSSRVGSALPNSEGPESAEADLLEEIMVPPEPGSVPARSSESSTPAAKGGGKVSRKFLGIGLVVLLLVGAGAWYLFTNRDSFFPNAKEGAAEQAPKADPIQRARKLHESGKEKLALSQLKRIQADSPHYGDAQALIAEWSAPQEVVEEETLAPELVRQREQLMAAAWSHADQREFLLVRSTLEEASQIAPLEPEELELSRQADENLRPFSSQLQLIEDREWDEALRDLWRFHLQDKSNPDIIHLIVDCYYNLGVRDLQRGNRSGATSNFREAFELAPEDSEAERHALFADTYEKRPPDLLYRIYVKYLPYR